MSLLVAKMWDLLEWEKERGEEGEVLHIVDGVSLSSLNLG